MKVVIFLTTLFITSVSFSQEKIIYEYKKYEKIDLGQMSVKGKLLTPGDISVRERKRRKFKKHLYFRENFDKEMASDVKDIR